MFALRRRMGPLAAASALLLGVLLAMLLGFWVGRLSGLTDGGPAYGFRATAFAALALASCATHAAAIAGRAYATRFFTVAFAVSLAAELAGVTTGAVFGRYAYSAAFPLQLLGLVPVVVPLIWCALSYLAFATAEALLRGARTAGRAGGLGQAAVAATLLLGYDAVADPNHVFRGGWSYAEGGAFYGVPAQNFFAWFVIGFAMFVLLVRLRPAAPAAPPATWLLTLPMPLAYLAVLSHESVFAFAVSGATGAGAIGLALAAACATGLARPARVRLAAAWDHWRSLRPAEVALMTAFPLAGFLLAGGPPRSEQTPELALCFLASFCVAASAVAFNSLEGLAADRLNNRLADHALVTGRVAESSLRALMLAFGAAGLAAFAWLSLASALMAALVLLCGFLYSSRRVRGKERPGLASLLHLAGAFAFYAAGAGGPPAGSASLFGGGALAILFMAGHLHHEVDDREADLGAGVRTLAVRHGPRRALLLGSSGFALFYGLVALAWHRGWWPAALALPFLAGAPVHAVALLALLKGPAKAGTIATYRVFYRALFLAMAAVAGVAYWAAGGS